MLDRTTGTPPHDVETLRPDAALERADEALESESSGQTQGNGGLARAPHRLWVFITGLIFSSLTRRIVILNVAGLVTLLVAYLPQTQFRAGLIEERIQSLEIQGEIIASALAAAASDSETSFYEPDRPLQLRPDTSFLPPDDAFVKFSLTPDRISPKLMGLIKPTNTRARIYDSNGYQIVDTNDLILPGQIPRFDLPPPTTERPGFLSRTWRTLKTWLNRGDLPLYHEVGLNAGKDYPEVAKVLAGARTASAVRLDERDEVIVSVVVPIKNVRAVQGALLLTTRGGDISDAVEKERLAIIKVFLIATSVMVLLSVLLAGTIAGPMRRLAESAEHVRRRIRSRVEIPDFTARRDEIGHLSGTLRDMTAALYKRIEAIERFAADVAHELKNPLTSLRSAVETLPLAKTPESRERLLEVIQHDVKRLDRLISDISEASRLDAELQRNEVMPVDLTKLLTTVVTVQNEMRDETGVNITLAFEGSNLEAFVVSGNDSRLGQVINNLIDNARSFSPPGATVRLVCRRLKDAIEIVVDDDGPGIQPDALAKIFERFYTDRPHQGFGQNSGLGLSISKQIIEAHGGRLWAENRTSIAQASGEPPHVLGARFVARLPVI